MDKVFETLKPDRGARAAAVTGRPASSRPRSCASPRASRPRTSGSRKTLVAAVVEKRNGLLLMDTSDGLGRLARRLDPPLGDQVGPRGAARERGRGRRAHLRRLPRRPPLLRGSGPAPADLARQRRRGQDPERAPHGRERREAADGPRVRARARDPAAAPARGPAAAAGLRAPRLQRRLAPGLGRLLRLPRRAPTARSTRRSPTSAARASGPALLMASLQASFHAWADEGVPVAGDDRPALRGDLAPHRARTASSRSSC